MPGPPFLLGALLVFITILLNRSLPTGSGGGRKIFRRSLFTALQKESSASDKRQKSPLPYTHRSSSSVSSALMDDADNEELFTSTSVTGGIAEVNGKKTLSAVSSLSATAGGSASTSAELLAPLISTKIATD